jgi:hypothetical protein
MHMYVYTYRNKYTQNTCIRITYACIYTHTYTHTHTHTPVVGTDSDRCDAILRALVVSERAHTLARIDVPQLRALVAASWRVSGLQLLEHEA